MGNESLPIYKYLVLKHLRHAHVNRLVRVSGVVTRRSTVLPQIKYVTFACTHCDFSLGPYYQGLEPIRIARCPGCQKPGPFRVKNEMSSYRNFQRITLQESPGTVPPGRLPRHKEVILCADLVDTVRPGEEVVSHNVPLSEKKTKFCYDHDKQTSI